MHSTEPLNTYRTDKSYDWNYDHAPGPVELEIPDVPGSWSFLGSSIDSPLGVAAGPLLNGAWVRYYASLGFSVLTYKTVRSSQRACYPAPNLTHVASGSLTGNEKALPESAAVTNSWAVSFGMPSKEPRTWRQDIEQTRNALPSGKLLSVSVVGSVQPDWRISDLADDYALTAKWAVDSGADCIETNFSCPNVASCDGQLYQQPEDAGLIAERVRNAIGHTPLLIKIGHFREIANNEELATALLSAIAPFVDGVATTNSIAATVADQSGQLLFDGQRRGICGDAIRAESIRQTKTLCQIIHDRKLKISVVGIGGIQSAAHVESYINAGAESVQLATAAMLNPLVGIEIRRSLASQM